MTSAPSEFAEFHNELRSVAGELLAKEPQTSWPSLVDAGWTGLEVSEEFGGAGATFNEVAVVAEQIGRAASSNDYFGAVVLTVGALKELSPNNSRDTLLAGVAEGSCRSALAFGDFTVTDGRLSGRADFVVDAQHAETLLVIAEDDDGNTVCAHTRGCVVTPTPVVDETRLLAAVSADGVAVDNVFAFGAPDAVQRLKDRAAVTVACDSLGVSEAMLSATVDYVAMRHQFGRPIGSFQAVKHACADMAVQVAVSRQLVEGAVAAVSEQRPDADVAVAMAASHVCAAAVDIAGKAMQLHGGIGYTWESGVHVYLKRATLNRSLFGSPAAHRRRLSQRYR